MASRGKAWARGYSLKMSLSPPPLTTTVKHRPTGRFRGMTFTGNRLVNIYECWQKGLTRFYSPDGANNLRHRTLLSADCWHLKVCLLCKTLIIANLILKSILHFDWCNSDRFMSPPVTDAYELRGLQIGLFVRLCILHASIRPTLYLLFWINGYGDVDVLMKRVITSR